MGESKVFYYIFGSLIQRGVMLLKDIVFECKNCKAFFTPSEGRAKEKMENDKVINICMDCEINKREKELMEEYI